MSTFYDTLNAEVKTFHDNQKKNPVTKFVEHITANYEAKALKEAKKGGSSVVIYHEYQNETFNGTPLLDIINDQTFASTLQGFFTKIDPRFYTYITKTDSPKSFQIHLQWAPLKVDQ